MGTGISIRHAVKRYEQNTVIPDLSVEIREGEFFTLLGPSGCGKTTLLRMIAGFNSIEDGDFFFDNTRINDLDPSKRNIGMVFQNYAIFPHLTVEKNVAFGLSNRREIPKEEKKQRVETYMKLMQIESFRNRLPEKLSGGQQQRVALARALAIEPVVLLMDEPLSNLDAKLRVEMRLIIKEVQNKMGITTVYVTHDQEEAMAVSDRIAVMNQGMIQQVGTPVELYQRPNNLFVATFIGHTNIMDASLVADENGLAVVFDGGYKAYMGALPCAEEGNIKVSVRPEDFIISLKLVPNTLHGRIETSVFLGLNTQYFIRLDNGTTVEVMVESLPNRMHKNGEEVYLQVKGEKINLLSEDGKKNLLTQPRSES